MHTLSSGLLVALAFLAAGCQWGGRPDGGTPTHSDAPYRAEPISEPEPLTDGEIVEPLGGADLTEAPPTAGTDGATVAVDTSDTAP